MRRFAVPALNVPPDDPEMAQLPFAVLKHPPESWMPFANVEEADVEVIFSTVASTALSWVEVPATEFLMAPAVESVMPPVERMPDAVSPLT